MTLSPTTGRFSGRAMLAGLALAAVLALPRVGMGDDGMAAKVEALVPDLERYIEKGMADFDVPGLAIGIVTGDKLVYAKGFGSRSKGGAPVDADTAFQIGSTTKAFLAATMALGVDRELLAWDDRIVDRHPGFRLFDGWVTQEFRLYDIIAQRSGMPTFANDFYGMLGASKEEMIHSLRHVEPTASFRADFTYTNITHLVAGDIVAAAFAAADWKAVVTDEILTPLGMTATTLTLEAMEAAANHAVGHVWLPEGTIEVPFTRFMPYDFEGAGAINSTVADMAHWLRLNLADGTFDGERIVSAENLAITRMPRVAIADKLSYAMGWVLQSTPGGVITWHNGGTTSFGAYVGLALDSDLGVVVLTNETNVGMPDAIGAWTLDRLLGNPEVDHLGTTLAAVRSGAEAAAAQFERPAEARPPLAAASLAARYDNPVFGATDVVADGDALVATVATGAKLRLDPWDGNVYTVALLPEGEMATLAPNLGPGPLGFAAFGVDPGGKMDRFRVTFFQEPHEYLFVRR